MRHQVCIIGGGPSGLLLGQLLHRAGIDTIILERRSRAHVLSRIRAGVLESGTCALMHEAGIADRLEREGFTHDGVVLASDGRETRIDFAGLIGRHVTVYGQTEMTQDLYAARDAAGAAIVHEAMDVTIEGADSDAPRVSWHKDGVTHRLDCDYVAGCDGFHGISRQTIPAGARREYEKVYPFGWLGILSRTAPVNDELIYANSPRGFALCSMRNDHLSRYYLQVALSDRVDDWSDARFWDELRRRIPDRAADALETGPAIEKSIAPLRSFIAEPMRWGRLFLVGDAAHIVPPTGAKGLNLAVSDVHYLSRALIGLYRGEGPAGIDGYSQAALARVWKASRFSWWMTSTLHSFPEEGSFGQRMQEAELDYLAQSRAAQVALAENYVGLPY